MDEINSQGNMMIFCISVNFPDTHISFNLIESEMVWPSQVWFGRYISEHGNKITQENIIRIIEFERTFIHKHKHTQKYDGMCNEQRIPMVYAK